MTEMSINQINFDFSLNVYTIDLSLRMILRIFLILFECEPHDSYKQNSHKKSCKCAKLLILVVFHFQTRKSEDVIENSKSINSFDLSRFIRRIPFMINLEIYISNLFFLSPSGWQYDDFYGLSQDFDRKVFDI